METLEIYIGEFQPLKGKGHMPLPKSIEKKKAIINIENEDDMCFKWAVTRALNPTNNHPKRVSKTLIEQSKELNWEGIEFPTPLNNIKKFEENNNISVNVFSADESLKVYPLRLTRLKMESYLTKLFLWKNYYSVIKDMSRLVSAQISDHGHKKHICNTKPSGAMFEQRLPKTRVSETR